MLIIYSLMSIMKLRQIEIIFIKFQFQLQHNIYKALYGLIMLIYDN